MLRLVSLGLDLVDALPRHERSQPVLLVAAELFVLRQPLVQHVAELRAQPIIESVLKVVARSAATTPLCPIPSPSWARGVSRVSAHIDGF